MGEPHRSVSPHCSRPVHLPSPQRAWLEHKSITTKSMIGWSSGCRTERKRMAKWNKDIQLLGKTPWSETLKEDMAAARYDEIMKGFRETCLLAYPSPDTKSACGWAWSGPFPSLPCRTARPLWGPSRTMPGRRSAERLLSWCRLPIDTRKRYNPTELHICGTAY